MAMDVEYEEYSSTSSSKHHGWKLEVSRRHRETQEMEALEARIAAEYAKIDHGISVGDLTAPRATNLIKEMDRSARLPGAIANGPLNDHEGVVMFLTYPDREGLCGALPTLQTLEESERESRRDAAEDEKNARDAKEKKNAPSAALAEQKDQHRKTLASRLVDAMPLVRRVARDPNAASEARPERLVVAAEPNGDGDGDGIRRDVAVSAFPSFETTRLSTRGTLVGTASCASRPLNRPDRLVEYDYFVGVDRARELTDAELHEMKGAVTNEGDVPDTAFRDLNQVD